MLSLKKKLFFPVIAIAVFGVLAPYAPAHAQETIGWVATIMSSIASVVIELAGKLLIVLIELLLVIVKYNDFINAPAVERGWILIRDFTNMAFLVIFIAIAYATILGVEKYEWKRLLPKLLMMAVAVNFSKIVCGVVIDASQVLMITFVNGFKDVAAGNLVRGLGLSEMLSIRSLGADENVTDSAIAAASILAVVLLVIAVIVLGVIVMMFLARILYLWILIVLAPLAFLMGATPGAEHLFKQWWDRLIRYAFVGPIMAFWLWLSFSVMAGVAPGSNLAKDSNFDFSGGLETGFGDVSGNTAAAISGISTSDQLLSYAISIALLIYSLIVAKGMGVKGAGIAGSALDKIKSGGIKLGKLAALGVATGGAGVPLGLLAGKGTYKAGKAGYSGLKKFYGTQFGKDYIDELDRAHGKGIVQKGARAASWIGGKTGLMSEKTQQRLATLQGENAPRLLKAREEWNKNRKLEREDSSSVSSAKYQDAYNLSVHGIVTDYAGQTIAGLIEKRSKEHAQISMDEDSLVSRKAQAEKDKEALENSDDDKAKFKAAIEVAALTKLIVSNNAQNTDLGAKFSRGEVTPDLIAAMGNIQANPENVAEYLGIFHAESHDKDELMGQVLDARKIADPAARKAALERITAELATKLQDTSEGAGKTTEELGQLVGNQLYAKKYRVYDQAQKSRWEGKELERGDDGHMYVVSEDGTRINENELLSHDVMAAGRGIVIDDATLKIKDNGRYTGTADVAHWQQAQEKTLKGLGKILKKDNYEFQFERDLGVEAIKANNLSFAFTVKEMTVVEKNEDGLDKVDANGKPVTRQILQKIDLSNAGDVLEHDNLFGAKLSNGSVGDAAKLHPMTTHQQSFSENGMFISTKAPTWGDQTIQATAAGDQRALATERVDSLLGLINLKRKDLQYPLSDDDKKNYTKLYYMLHNPINGIVDRLPQANFAIRGTKLLQILSVDGVSSQGDFAQHMKSLGLDYGANFSKSTSAGSSSGKSGAGSVIVQPGSPEFRETDQALKNRGR